MQCNNRHWREKKEKKIENKRHLVERGNLGETIEREEERKEIGETIIGGGICYGHELNQRNDKHIVYVNGWVACIGLELGVRVSAGGEGRDVIREIRERREKEKRKGKRKKSTAEQKSDPNILIR